MSKETLRLKGVPTTDAFLTFDQATIDSTVVFLVGELERLDPAATTRTG